MKNLVSFLAGFLALCGLAKGNIQKAQNLTAEESQKVAEALDLLKDKEVLSKDNDGKFELDKDIIQKLKNEGYLKKKGQQIQTICNGGGGGHS